jgi:hypothetical protein
MATTVAVTLLRELSRQFEARSPAKLLAVARRHHIPVTPNDIKEALAPEIGKQIFAPKTRSLGKSAAEGPGERLQADLIDLSSNAKAKAGDHKYALMVTDVFSRKTWTEALRYKDSGNVNNAMRNILSKVPGDGKNAILTTDQGNEFKKIDAHVLGVNAVHREKETSDKNATSVVDRSMQTIKKDLAARIARTGHAWKNELPSVTEAYNERPSSAVHGAPNTATEGGSQQFMIEQDNASKFMHNRNLTIRRQDAIKETGAFRAPIQGESRSFRPAYSDTVQTLGKISLGAGYVTNTTGKKTLLKEALPVPKGSGKAVAHLTAPRRNAQPSAPDKSTKPSVAPPPPPPVAPPPPTIVVPVPKARGRPPSGKPPNPKFVGLRATYS